MRLCLGAVAAGVLALAPCGVRGASTQTLQVLAAASLTDAFRDLGKAFEKARPGSRVELSFAGSQILRTQIEQGAPGDVFASADLDHAQALVRAGLLRDTQVFARNRIALVVPAEGAKVRRLEDLARAGIKLVVAGASVPVGRYTSQVVSNLGASGLFGEDFQARVQANVVSQETNVRVVLSKVALGEADAGFVYVTDSMGSDKVRRIEIPDQYNVVAEYPIGVLSRSGSPDQAKAFVDLVLGSAGQAILREHGFVPNAAR